MKWLVVLFVCMSWIANQALAQGPPPGFPYISEIMYNPPETGADSLEFIEITADNVSGSPSAGDYFSSGIEFTFPADFQTLSPSQSVVIAKDSVAFENVFGVQAYQWSNSSLLNSGEPIVWRGSNASVRDSVFYETTAPWPEYSNGTGRSIELCSAGFGQGWNPLNWGSSQNNTGVIVNGATIYASPGVHPGNCLTVGVQELMVPEPFQIFPNPTVGNFGLSFEKLKTNSTLTIFDSKGSLVHSEVVLNGTSKLEKRLNLNSGVYLIKLQSAEDLQTLRLMVTD